LEQVQSAAGLVLLLVIAWGLSENRRAVPWRIVLVGLALQLVLAALLLKAPPLQGFFLALNEALLALERATQAGTSLVFGWW
jgi:CNT family concentrative nucleoside transporter